MKTLRFIFKSLKENVIILEQEQKWWLALIILLISVIAAVSGTLYSSLNSSASSITQVSTETGIDKGFEQFAGAITEEASADQSSAGSTTGTITITDGKLTGTGVFAPKTISEDDLNASANATYTHDDNGTTLNVLSIYVIDGIDPVANSSDNDILTSFIDTSIYQNDADGTATWTPCSFMILTPTSVHISTYAVVNASSTDSALKSISGSFANIGIDSTFNFYSIGHASDGTALSDSEIDSNMVSFLNKAYDTVKIPAAWYQTGINAAMDLGVIIIGGMIFWLMSRSKNSIKRYTLWQSEKALSFMALTPALITLVVSFFFSEYASFFFLLIYAFRIMSAVQRLSANSQKSDNKPVYKARS